MRVVDDVLLPLLRTTGVNVHDGFMQPNNPDGHTVIRYDLPYVVYYSSVGMDANRRLTGRRGRRSVFFAVHYVGIDRNQAKWAGERVRSLLQDQRISVPGHKTWLCALEESQRIRRDDDAIRPDGKPLFYGIDNYALSITLTHQGATS